jgi:hypothetical protein
MRLTATVLVGGTALALALSASAQEVAPPSRLSRTTVFAAVGYAYPLGGTELGNEVRDVSFGRVPLWVGGDYDLGRSWSTQLRLNYAVSIPTLCASGSDCVASLGHGIGVEMGIARTLPRWRSFTAQVALYLGWEWLSTRLSDSGVTATRRWNGPSAGLDVFVDLRSRGPWIVGPAIGISGGIFTHDDLETPAWRTSGATSTAWHAWPAIAFRIGRRM